MSNWRIRQAVATLNKGGIIAYPTEAVYGLGCDPWDEQAVSRLLTIKQRPWQKGLILIAADFNQLQSFINPVPPEILKQLEATWPGPTTWLLPINPDVPDYLCGEHDTIAVRVTAHKQTAELCRSFGDAIISTSANLTGQRPAKTSHEVRWQLPDIDYVLPGPCGGADKPSEIRDAQTGERIR
ncbi:MAG: L-threonylcarbamoyladenylate synthase [Gammaproteobacteria bacterium]|nr:L-threonylcarbamoyladenylate synthase [Gammaproteobacteria bacterium]